MSGEMAEAIGPSDGRWRDHNDKNEKIVSHDKFSDIIYTEPINVTMSAVCQIVFEEKTESKVMHAFGTGFLFKYRKNSKNILGLMTNNHVISMDTFNSKKSCELVFESLGKLRLELKFRDCNPEYFVTSPENELDATFIRLPGKIVRKLKKKNAVWLCNIVEVKVDDKLFIIQHPIGENQECTGKSVYAPGEVKNLDGYLIHHTVNTLGGSSGSPVVKYEKQGARYGLVGLHRGWHDDNWNEACNVKHILETLLGGIPCSGGSEKARGGGITSKGETADGIDDDDDDGYAAADDDDEDMDVDGGSTGDPAVKPPREKLSNDEIKRRIRSNFSTISKFDPKGRVLDELQDILTPAQTKELNENSLDQKRGSDLLFMLHRGAHPSVYVRLLQVLEEMVEYKWIVDIIYENKPETENKIKPKIYNNYATLAGSLNPTDEMLNMLFDKHILTDAERVSFDEPDYHEEDKGRDCLQLVLLSPNPEACGVLLDCIMNESTLEWMVNDETSAGVDQKEDPELTNDKIKQRLADNYAEIVKDFDPTGHVLDFLFQEKILTSDMYKQLYKETPRDNRGRVLIDHLRGLEGHPNSYRTLLRSLPKEGNEGRIELLSIDRSGSSAIPITLKKEIEGLSNEEIKNRVKKNFPKFVAGFQANSLVLDGLLTANVITPRKCQEYNKTKERDRGRKLILDLLETSNPHAFVVLYNIINGKEGFKDKVELINNDN